MKLNRVAVFCFVSLLFSMLLFIGCKKGQIKKAELSPEYIGGGMFVVRGVEVNRAQTPEQALEALGWRKEIRSKTALSAMPKGGNGRDPVDVFFFDMEGGNFTPDDVARAYEERGLQPDYYAHMAALALNPVLPDAQRAHASMEWRDKHGNRGSIEFHPTDRIVFVDGGYSIVGGDVRFAGVLKPGFLK